MALVERLMKWDTELDERHIPVHAFFAAITEVMAGRLTAAQVQSYLAMTPEDIADWNAIVATMPVQAQAANRALWATKMHAVFLLAEDRYPQYSTPAEVRTKLGI